MVVDIVFSESDQSFNCNFGEVTNLSDGGFEKGYEDGYSKGKTEGYSNGYSEGHGEGYSLGTQIGYEQGLLESIATIDSMIDRSITSISSQATMVGRNALYSCASLVSASFPNAIEIYDNAFRDCSNLEYIDFPKAVRFYGYSFRDCKKLSRVDLPCAEIFYSNVFNGCSELQTLILRADKVCNLSNTAILGGTKIEGGTGFVYVPDNLVDSYKKANNWSTFANQIKPISELN